ncbi:ISAs1 family transposase, partial [Allorhizobium terrae]|uniref:ISAs1 family transposase n=1 Tax=Allorhizobium terrae TaxID=1848972 RepID=UPI002EDA5D61
MECFGDIEDPRAANARHDLYELLFIALLASLCGAQTCEDFSVFGESRRELLSRFLVLRHGIASHDTFSRVFRLLDPVGFERAFREFMSRFYEGLSGVVALDGKALRRAYDKGRSHAPAMMVSAFAAQTRMTLANLPVVGGNERDAVLYLIDMISLKGATVT